MAGISWTVIFALLLVWAYRGGHRQSLLVLWAVLFGIALGDTALGNTLSNTATGVLSAMGTAVVSAFNGAVG